MLLLECIRLERVGILVPLQSMAISLRLLSKAYLIYTLFRVRMASRHRQVLLHECLPKSLRLPPQNGAQCPDVEELIGPRLFPLLKLQTLCLTISNESLLGIAQLSIVQLYLNIPYHIFLY